MFLFSLLYHRCIKIFGRQISISVEIFDRKSIELHPKAIKRHVFESAGLRSLLVDWVVASVKHRMGHKFYGGYQLLCDDAQYAGHKIY